MSCRIFGGFVAAAIIATPVAPAVAAGRYAVNLTRDSQNLYRVQGKQIWVQTRYCYVYGYGEKAALSASEVVFLDSGQKCDVKQVLGEADIGAGTYEVSLSHEGDDLYSTLEGVFVKTSMCFNYAFSEDAILRIGALGTGTVIFIDDERKCAVETVLSKLRL